MNPESKTVYQHETVVINSNEPPQGNPPPYTGAPQQVYAQNSGHYAPGPQYGQPQVQTAVVMGPTVIIAQQMGPTPANVTCKSCHANVVTRIETNATTKTHLFALLLCVLGCWPCVCIPYCMDDCMNANHYCPNCNAYLGSHNN